KRVIKHKDSELGEDVSEAVDETLESIELETTEILPTPVEEQPTEVPTPIETEVVSKTKKSKKRWTKHKDSEFCEDVSEAVDETLESIELETTEILPTPSEEQPTEVLTPIETEVVSKTKKIKKRLIKHKDSELGEDVSEAVDQTLESIRLETAEILPTPSEEQPTEVPTPIETEVVSKTKKIKKRLIKHKDSELGEDIS